MDAAQCLATLKALGAEAAVVADIVMDPAWRRDVKAVQSCAAAATTNAFAGRRSTRRAAARACQWLRNKVAPDLRKAWDATIRLGQHDVVETTVEHETAEDAAGDVLMQLVSTGSLVDDMDQTLPKRFGEVLGPSGKLFSKAAVAGTARLSA